MTVQLFWHIQIGQYKLQLVDSIAIVNSTEQLVDTCIIKLPSSTLNKAEKIEPFVRRGDKVIVKSGYDLEKMITEFEGYVLKLDIQNDGIEIQCEDALYLFRKKIANKQFGVISLKALAQHIIKELKLPITVSTSFEFTYEKYTIHDANGYDVLKKIQEDTKANVYVKGNVLHIEPAYTEKFGEVIFDFEKNIEKGDLEWKDSDDKKVQIEITSTNTKGEILKATVGSEGGEKFNIVRGSNFNQNGLQKLASEELKKAVLDGYSGSLTTWLTPFVQSGFTAEIIDADYEARNGSYYVKKVETTISAGGGVRKIEIGKKLTT